eukprot:EG_transcript_2095
MKAEKTEMAHVLRQEADHPLPHWPTPARLTSSAVTSSFETTLLTSTSTSRPAPTMLPWEKGVDALEAAQVQARMKRLEQQVQRLQREKDTLQAGEEALQQRAGRLAAALQEANATVAAQRQRLEEFAAVKCDAQARLRQEYEQRERELTAKYVREKEAAAALLLEKEMLVVVNDQRVAAAQSSVEERWRARLKSLEDQHQAELRPLLQEKRRLEEALAAKEREVQATGQAARGQERLTLQREIQELKRKLKLEHDVPHWPACLYCGVHCNGACSARRIEELQGQLADLQREKVAEVEAKEKAWEQRWREREAMANAKHAEVVGQLRGVLAEQQMLLELKVRAKEGEAEARAAQERESGRRERQALAAEHAARLAELRRLLEEERGELEARVVAERTARLAAESEYQERLVTAAETADALRRKDIAVAAAEDKARRLEAQLKDSEARLAALHERLRSHEEAQRQVPDAVARGWQARLEREAAAWEGRLRAKDAELVAIRGEVEREQQISRAERQETLAQLAEVVRAGKEVEAQHAAHVRELQQGHERRLRELEDRLRKENNQAVVEAQAAAEREQVVRERQLEVAGRQEVALLRQEKAALAEQLRQREEYWSALLQTQLQQYDATKQCLDGEVSAVLASREVEWAQRLRRIAEDCQAELRQVRDEAAGQLQRLQAQYDEKCRELEDCRRDLQESDANFKELETQLREVLGRVGSGSAAEQALRARVQALEHEVEERKEEANRAWTRAKEVDNQCKTLKERLREVTNDSTTQRMFPLLGLEISEGNTLREDLRHQGVHVLAVRGPAQHAGVEVDDLIQHLEIHHSAVVHDLYDFKQCVDKVRPGDIVTATILRSGMRLSRSVEVEASFSNPYKRHVYRSASPTVQPAWVSRLASSAV